MLLRLFDREGLQLIPGPGVRRAAARAGGPAATRRARGRGDRMDRARRTDLAGDLPAGAGLAPYYNVLHPRVQQAMLAVVRELVAALRAASVVRRPGDPAYAPRATPSFPAPSGAWTTSPSPASNRRRKSVYRARIRPAWPPGLTAHPDAKLAPAARPDALPSGPASSPTAALRSGCNGGPTSWAASTAASNRS